MRIKQRIDKSRKAHGHGSLYSSSSPVSGNANMSLIPTDDVVESPATCNNRQQGYNTYADLGKEYHDIDVGHQLLWPSQPHF